MYASVYDAALAVGIAVHNLMNSGREVKETMDFHFTDSACPLRSASARRGGLGWKLLHQLKKVTTAGFSWRMMFAVCTEQERVIFLSSLLASKSILGFHFN